MTVAQNEPPLSARPLGLPDFERPPVVETVLGVSFHEVPQLDTVQLGRLWERHFAEDFPEHREAPPYDAPVERFEGHVTGTGPSISLNLGQPPRRYLFSSGTHLVQVQRDWFAFNWRKTSPDGRYERYESGRQQFERCYRALDDFLAEETEESIQPTQCEVTYVNHIKADADMKPPLLDSVMEAITFERGKHLPLPDEAEFSCRFTMESRSGIRGRLHVDVRSGAGDPDIPRLAVLTLTARGTPPSPSLEGVLEFLDRGRDWIVQGFDELTTEQMHVRWGKLTKEGMTQ